MNTENTSELQSVLWSTTFPTADAKYKALVAASEREGRKLTDRFSGCSATEELSEVESQMFGIEAAEVPALYWAYARYENLIGDVEIYFGDFTDQERIDHAQFFTGERLWSFDLAVWFMQSVCGLPGPKCLGWVSKIVAAQIRAGVYL